MKKKKNVRPLAARQRLSANAGTVKVKSPRNLTPALCDRLRRDLLKACQEVAEIHGLIVEGEELSDIDLRHGFDIGFRVGIPMNDGSLYSTDRALFEVFAEHFGLKPSDYGRAFRSNGESFRITAINPNRPKFPISAERVADGRGYKFAAENVALYLQNSKHHSVLQLFLKTSIYAASVQLGLLQSSNVDSHLSKSQCYFRQRQLCVRN